MYSPKIREDLIPYLYQMAKKDSMPMTKVVDKMIRPQTTRILTTEDLNFLLAGSRIVLDCGHEVVIGHNFVNTVIIVSMGGGAIKTFCHNCGY